MNINEWLHKYVSMILRPIVLNKGFSGFVLSNNMTILFKDTKMSQKSLVTLKRHYDRIGLFR